MPETLAPPITQTVAEPAQSSPRKWRRTIAAGFLLVVVAGSVASAWAYQQTGSAALIVPYLSGQRVLLNPPCLDLGKEGSGVVQHRSVSLVNLSSQEVKLMGVRGMCGPNSLCANFEEQKYPITIPPGGSHDLRLMISTPQVGGKNEVTAKVFVEAGTTVTRELAVRANVRSSKKETP